MKRLLTINTVARFLAISPVTVRRWVTAGLLPSVRLGRCVRIREIDVEKLTRPRKDHKGS